MAKIVACVFLFCCTNKTYGQNLNDLRNFYEIHSCHLGFAGQKSAQFRIADSLLAPLDKDSLMTLTKDSSYVLKYYAFLHLLPKNDSLAFEVLKTYKSDSTLISTHFSCVMSSGKFNQILISEYIRTYESKYKYGGRGAGNCFTYHYPKTSRKIWRIKRKEFNRWAITNNFENYIL